MRSPLKERPLLFWSAAYLIVVAICVGLVFGHTGRIAYSLDDAYIHLSIAENLAQHGVWGVTPYAFSWSASSLLWPVLLAAFYYPMQAIFTWTPLFLNVFLGLVILAWTDRWLSGKVTATRTRPGGEEAEELESDMWAIPERARWIVPALLVLLLPLPLMTVNGMEHLLHIVLMLLFLECFVHFGFGPDTGREGWVHTVWLALSAMLLGSVRYEAILLLFVACLWWLLRGQWRRAIVVGIAAWIPAGIGGLIALSHDWAFFPYSVLLKTTPSWMRIKGALEGLVKTVLRNGFYMIFPVVSFALLLARHHLLHGFSSIKESFWSVWRSNDRPSVLLLIYAAATVLHLIVARCGWQLRYEAYFVAAGLILIPLAGAGAFRELERWRRRYRMVLLVSICLGANALAQVAYRVPFWHLTVTGPNSIHDQQVHMGLFLREYYNEHTVLANDVGAINYYSDIHCIDLFGLGSKESAQAYIEKNATRLEAIEVLEATYNPAIAVVFLSWLGDAPPPHWTLGGTWFNPNNTASGDHTVHFFALNEEGAGPLREALREYAKQLPDQVITTVDDHPVVGN